jgi:hypothetical protein
MSRSDDHATSVPLLAPETTARRLSSQLLVGDGPEDPVDVARHLLAIQAQDLRGAKLAIRARTAGLTVSDVDRAISDDRSVVVTWLNRGTVHLVAVEDLDWLHVLTTRRSAAQSSRRLAQLGVDGDDADRAVEIVVRKLGADGPGSRDELRAVLESADLPAAAAALYQVLFQASSRGDVVRGPLRGTQQTFVRWEDWVGPHDDVDVDVAAGELARRFLIGHGPATARDLAKWAGVTLTLARAGLRRIGAQLVEHPDATVSLEGRDPRDDDTKPPPLLLGAFDPLLHGWVDRTPVTGEHTGIVTTNGLFRPFVLVDGRAAGLWRFAKGRVTIEPFAPLSAKVSAALDGEAADVIRFVDV